MPRLGNNGRSPSAASGASDTERGGNFSGTVSGSRFIAVNRIGCSVPCFCIVRQAEGNSALAVAKDPCPANSLLTLVPSTARLSCQFFPETKDPESPETRCPNPASCASAGWCLTHGNCCLRPQKDHS